MFERRRPVARPALCWLGLATCLAVLLVGCTSEPPSQAADASSLAPVIVDEPGETPEGMVWVSGGDFIMGTNFVPKPGVPNPDRIKQNESPAHTVELDGFWMDDSPVTNREFLEFVEQTDYVTFAEQTPTREDFSASGVDISLIKEEDLKPGSICFNQHFDPSLIDRSRPGWEYAVWQIVGNADWRHPNGPDSSIDDRMDHPVVHVTWDDAVAYCEWAGKRLPTEAEFEFAASNRGETRRYPWGDELTPDETYVCNFWQGEFPTERLNLDGFETTAPVKSFPPNELGLYDMAGNVWEWCHDYFHAEYYANSPRRNPQGPEESFDPQEPGLVKRVQRGGSFMCNTNNCTGFRCSARMSGEVKSSSFHNGFRCVVDTTMIETFQNRQAAIEKWRAEKQTGN